MLRFTKMVGKFDTPGMRAWDEIGNVFINPLQVNSLEQSATGVVAIDLNNCITIFVAGDAEEISRKIAGHIECLLQDKGMA